MKYHLFLNLDNIFTGFYHSNLYVFVCLKCCIIKMSWEGGREADARGKRYVDICICITDSLCYKAETNTPL